MAVCIRQVVSFVTTYLCLVNVMPCSDQMRRKYLHCGTCAIIITANHIWMNPERRDFSVIWLQQMWCQKWQHHNAIMSEFILPQVCQRDNKQTILHCSGCPQQPEWVIIISSIVAQECPNISNVKVMMLVWMQKTICWKFHLSSSFSTHAIVIWLDFSHRFKRFASFIPCANLRLILSNHWLWM